MMRLSLLDAIAMVSAALSAATLVAHLPSAWVMGAADPTSGTVSLHEIIRGFGALLKQGWKPLRTGDPSL